MSHFEGFLYDDALSLSESSMSHHFSPEVESAMLGVQFIAQHIRDNDKENEVIPIEIVKPPSQVLPTIADNSDWYGFQKMYKTFILDLLVAK